MNFKKLKQEMEVIFSRLLTAVEEGSMPDIKDVKQFAKLASRLQNFADDSWAYEAEDFAHLSNQLIGAIKSEDIQELYTLISTLDDSKNYCHRTFKEE